MMNVSVAAEISNPRACGLSSGDVLSAAIVEIIGWAMADAIPDIEKAINRVVRFGENPLPIPDTRWRISPAIRIFLGPYLLLITPVRMEPIIASEELSVDICPVIPTGALNDSAISSKSSPEMTHGVQFANIATNRDGISKRFFLEVSPI
jgi:hypothetical protein